MIKIPFQYTNLSSLKTTTYLLLTNTDQKKLQIKLQNFQQKKSCPFRTTLSIKYA